MFPEQITDNFFARTSFIRERNNNWSPSGPEYLIKVYSLIDVTVFIIASVTAMAVSNLTLIPAGMAGFLRMQITVSNLLLLSCGGFVWHRIFKFCQLYDLTLIRNHKHEAKQVLLASLLGGALLFLLLIVGKNDELIYHTTIYFWAVAASMTLVIRNIVHVMTPEWTPLGHQPRRLLILGSGPRALKLYRSLIKQPKATCRIIGFVDTRSTMEMNDAVTTRMIGSLNDLESILTNQIVDEVLIALPIKSCYSQIQQAIGTCERIGIECKYLSDIFQVSQARTHFESNKDLSLVSMKMVDDGYRLLIKRALDVSGALAALILFSPFMLLAAIAVKITSRGPAIFVQERHGLNKRRFKMFKFRTMVQNAEALQVKLEDKNEAQGPVFKIKNDPRVTLVGKFLRKTSIDELPQLVNILRGDMSLVGPRPLPERDVSRFPESSLLRRFSVKPGLTCLWQINGRSNTDFDNWIRQDLKYIDEWSLGLDLAILLKTVPAVIKGRGAV